MDLQAKRKLEVNKWNIKLKWFYISILTSFGVLLNITGYFDFKYQYMITLSVISLIIVGIFQYWVIKIEKTENYKSLDLLSLIQLIVELIIFTILFYLSGSIESVTVLFYVLSIIASSTLYSSRGTFLVALSSGASIFLVIAFEVMNILPHFAIRENSFDRVVLSSAIITKAAAILVLYIIIAFYSNKVSKILISREQMLIKHNLTLEKEKEYRENEFKQLDKATKLLVKRDLELKSMNKKMSKKIQEAEKSEMSMLKAFYDLKKERKRTEEEKDKTEAIISNFIDPILVMDERNRLSLVNPAAKSIFSLRDEELGQEISADDNYSMNNFVDIIKTDYVVKKSKNIRDEETFEEEVYIKYAGQEVIYKVITAAVVGKNNENYGIMKIFYNLTREKMIDKLKSEFISIAAHQLRTPLSAIKWAIKIVLDEDEGKLNDSQKQMLSKGYTSNERIIKLVNDMLNVSRIEEGRFGYSFSKDHIEDALEEVLGTIENKAKTKEITINVEKPESTPALMMDKTKIVLVLQNLIENAVKYTPDHGRIDVRIREENKYLHISIKDNGVGIPEVDQEKLFSKFFRAENVVRMQTEGSGLGLFMVKNIINKHGGDISFNSEEGVGTEFIITVPIGS